MLHLETVSDGLAKLIRLVCANPAFDQFRLVGGTALSLYYGHRISVDADFFTDKSFDKHFLDYELVQAMPGIFKVSESQYGSTWVTDSIKVDFYDWKVPFIQPSVLEDGFRLASIEDIAAYKLDAAVGRKTEKDFRDIAQLLDRFSLDSLLGFYRQKYPYNSPKIVIEHLLAIDSVDADDTLVLLNLITWVEVKQQILAAVDNHLAGLIQQKEDAQKQREDQINALLARRRN